MAQLTDEQLADIAHDFYLSKLNIADISKKYDLSRYLITKALDDAELKGIVQIKITREAKRNQILEREFQKRYHLKEVVILESLKNKEEASETVISFAAKQIEIYLKNAKVAGISWGSTMRAVISNFKEENLTQLTFVQLIGQAINSNKRKNPLAQEAAEKFHAKSCNLPAPIYVIDPKIIPALKKEPYFKIIESSYQKLDLLFTGLGTFESFKTNQFLQNNYSKQLFKNIPQDKIAGMIMGRPYDINGHFFDDFEKHICGVSMADIMKTPIRFCVVRNRFKSEALLGALRSGIITHLVTNEVIAQRILQNDD